MDTPMFERETSFEGSPEYDAFITKVQAFYQHRGTSFDPRPKVGTRRVDLLRLYQRVVGLGGYDVVSDTKSQKLAWRSIGQEFNLGTTNLPALAFNLKTVYYKYLAAYEIVDVHGKEPPPREIFEDVSAKGGNVLGRTLENFVRPQPRDPKLADGTEVEGSDGDDHNTPRIDKMEVDEPSSLRERRNLRQAPPQRVLFQGDMSTMRQSRHNMATSPTPHSGYPYGSTNGASSHNSNLPTTLANYEPRQQVPLTLRPVTTPSNNPEAYKALELARRDAILAKYPTHSQQPKGMMMPGTGFTGPSIYIRTLLSLQSGVLEEQEYALHHLVKISHERGDKYRFDGFSGLAEALVETVLQIGSLLGNGHFDISYNYQEQPASSWRIDGMNGTPDILEKAQALSSASLVDRLETSDYARRLCLINEAGLVLRNMVMLEENAEFISKYPAMRDLVVILLYLPDHASTNELRHYGFDLAEQLSKYLPANEDDALLKALTHFIDESDRAIVLASLRAISRMGTSLAELTPIHSIPVPTIIRICDWLLVEDQELRTACLDLLYRYTAVVKNIEALLDNFDVEVLIGRIVRLLLYGAKPSGDKLPDIPGTNPISIASANEETPIPKIPTELVEQLLLFDEPERSSQWLRTCFEEDPSGEITQIALWQAYQIPFAPYAATRPLLPAKDFITNVSSTFIHASAQVMNNPAPRFVIKGINPRSVPVDPNGQLYSRCLWHNDDGAECGEFAMKGKLMWEHIVSAHLGVVKDEAGAYDLNPLETTTYNCRWAGCTKYDGLAAAPAFSVGMHVKTHMSTTTATNTKRNGNVQQTGSIPQSGRAWAMYNTITDERNDAIGLPLTSALVLRNLARMLPKTAAGMAENAENLVWRYFGGVKDQLYYVMAHNQPLREYLAPLVLSITAEVAA